MNISWSSYVDIIHTDHQLSFAGNLSALAEGSQHLMSSHSNFADRRPGPRGLIVSLRLTFVTRLPGQWSPGHPRVHPMMNVTLSQIDIMDKNGTFLSSPCRSREKNEKNVKSLGKIS